MSIKYFDEHFDNVIIIFWQSFEDNNATEGNEWDLDTSSTIILQGSCFTFLLLHTKTR